MALTLREFIMNEGCCGKKPCAAKDFDDDNEVSGDGFEFIVKVKVDGDDEADAKKKLKDALSDFSSVKIKGDKKEKKAAPKDDDEADEDNDEEQAPISDDGPRGSAPAAKRFKKQREDVCPNCGKLFSKCTCK